MPTISQKLTFDASGASRSLTTLSNKLTAANAALAKFQNTAKSGAGGLTTLENKTKTAKKAADSFVVSWRTLSRVVATQLVVRSLNSLINGLENATERARELGLAVEEIRTISGTALGASAADVNDAIIDLSARLSQDVQEVAEGVYQTLSNQVVDAADALGFYEKAANLANVTNAESSDVINALSSVMNSYGLTASDTSEVMDQLFKTIELGRIRMGELGSTLGAVTPLASQMGVDFNEVAAALAVMTRQGVKTNKAITQLRAILQKLLRPGEQLQELFNKWGVDSGPEAIRAFGGLQGVLSKIREETNGNVALQGEFFQRVRAITGELALGVNNGEDFADAINRIGDSAGVASAAIDQFRSSAAFQLTQAQQEVEASWTRLGKELIPAATAALKFTNAVLEDFAGYVRFISNNWNDSTVAVDLLNDSLRESNKELQEYKDSLEEPVEITAFKALQEEAAAYYTQVNKEEIRLKEVREGSIKAAASALEGAQKSILGSYENSIKNLEKFIEQSKDVAKSAAEDIADIETEIQDRQLQERLEKARSNFEKLQILESQYAKARFDAAQAARDLDASPESRKAALEAEDRARSYAEQVKQLARQEGLTNRVSQNEQRIQASLRNKQEILREYVREQQKAAELAADELTSRRANAKTLSELLAREKELLDLAQRESVLGDPESYQRVKDELVDVKSQINEIFAEGQEGAKKLGALGLDEEFGRVAETFQQALNQAEFDWAREVTRAQEEFERRVFKVKLEIDPTGLTEFGAAGLGLQQGADEGTAAFAQRAGDKAVEIQEQRIEGLRKIQEAQIRINAAAEAENLARNKSAGVLEEIQRNIEGTGARTTRVTDAYYEQLQLARQISQTISNQVDQAQEGQAVDDRKLQAINKAIEALENEKQINVDQIEALKARAQQLENIKQQQENINTVTEELPSEELLQAANNVQQGFTAAAERAAELQGKSIEAKLAVENTVNAANNLNTGLQDSARSAGLITTQVNGVQQSIQTAIGGANSLTAAFNRAAQAAAAAAQAGAAASGAAQYHGGPMSRFFQSGGRVTRGQDRILTSLSAGETVVNSRNSRRFFSQLNAMNQGSQPVFRDQGGSVTNVGDVNVTVQGGDTSQQTVREIAFSLRRAIKRGEVKLY
jgi:TP901 family phage tail tape measure protein